MEPDLSKLGQVPWLDGWRLFLDAMIPAWYLDGHNTIAEVILSSPLTVRQFDPDSDVLSIVKKIQEKIDLEKGAKSSFNKNAFLQCAALSKALDQSVICVFSDDEGSDSSFLFNQGELVKARMQIDWDKGLIVHKSGEVELERFYPEGTDPDDADLKPRIIYQIAREETSTYFGDNFLWDELIDPDAASSSGSSVNLIAQRGHAPKQNESFKAILKKKLGDKPDKKQIISALSPVVEAVITPGFSHASNQVRFNLDEQVGECYSYILSDPWERTKDRTDFRTALQQFLSDLGSYTRALRPKPEFRKNPSVLPYRRSSLAARWAFLKLRSLLPL